MEKRELQRALFAVSIPVLFDRPGLHASVASGEYILATKHHPFQKAAHSISPAMFLRTGHPLAGYSGHDTAFLVDEDLDQLLCGTSGEGRVGGADGKLLAQTNLVHQSAYSSSSPRATEPVPLIKGRQQQ